MKYLSILFGLFLFPYGKQEFMMPVAGKENNDTLKVGDNAPPLSIAKWIKGKPVNGFKKDSIYVIEFGFASCTPCRAGIPHLSELALKYAGKIKIISVHIWENDKDKPEDLSYIKKVEQFVKQLGGRISFTVAVDTPEQLTADTWGGGAPKTFVVGRDGKIAWIGNPFDLKPVIENILSDTFDARKVAIAEKKETDYIDEMMKTIWKNRDMGNTDACVSLIDALIDSFPAKTYLYYFKYHILDGLEPGNEKANAWIKWLLKTKPAGFFDMFYLSNDLVESKYPDYDLAIAMADWAFEKSSYNFAKAFILNIKSYAYFKQNNIAEAIKIQQQAIALIEPGTTQMDKAIEDLERRLKRYQAALK